MKNLGNRLFRLRLLRSKAGVFQFSLVRKKRAPIRAENKDLLGNRVNELLKLPPGLLLVLPQLLLALPESLVGALLFGNIADGTQENRTVGRSHRAEHDVNRKFGAIFASAVKL